MYTASDSLLNVGLLSDAFPETAKSVAFELLNKRPKES